MGDHRPKIEQRIVRELALIGLLLSVALFQTALAPALWHFRIDWVLVAVVSWSLIRGLAAGLRWACYGGIMLDLLSPLPVGAHLCALLVAVTVVAVTTESLPRDNRLVPTASVVLVSLLYALCLGAIMAFTGRPVAWSHYPLTVIVPTALANGAATLPVYLLQDRFNRPKRQETSFDF
jgi:rod shape-determining protein MreD